MRKQKSWLNGYEPLEPRQFLSVNSQWSVAAVEASDPIAGLSAVIDDQYVLRMQVTARGKTPFDYPHTAPVMPAGWSAREIGFGLYRITAPGTTLQQVRVWGGGAGAKYVEAASIDRVSAVIPNDPGYVDPQPSGSAFSAGLWGMKKIDMPTAWGMSRGSAETVVAVIDSGIDATHPDISGNLWVNRGEIPGNGLDDDVNGYVDDVHGWNAFLGTGDIEDLQGHGTHVAGTIAAVGNNGIGVTGVAWNAQLMPVNASIPGGSGLANIADAFAYVVKQKLLGVNVVAINASFSGSLYRQADFDMISLANAAGITVIATAGNLSRNNDVAPRYPASYNLPNIVSVAASTNAAGDPLASFSNYGKTSVDIAAPGEGILSTWPRSLIASGYNVISGTSMAAPLVTGTVVILKSLNRSATVSQVRAAILGAVDRSPYLEGIIASGGRLNVPRAIQFLRTGATVPPITNPPPFTGIPSVSITNASIAEGHSGFQRMTFTISVNRATPTGTRVTYTTLDGTALSGRDYVPTSGTAFILPNQTTASVTVLVRGNRLIDGNRNFRVNLANPVNASIVKGSAIGTIHDDDGAAGAGLTFADLATSAGETIPNARASSSASPAVPSPPVVSRPAFSGVDAAGSGGATPYRPQPRIRI